MIALTAIIVSCNRDEFNDMPVRNPLEGMTIKATRMPSTLGSIIISEGEDGFTISEETKTTVVYGNTNYGAGETSHWLANDLISMFFYSGNTYKGNVIFRATSVNGSSAVFVYESGYLPEDGTYTVKSISPGSVSYNETLAYFAIPNPQTQVGRSANHIGPYDFMYDEDVMTVSGGVLLDSDINLFFTRLCSMLRFSLKSNNLNNVNIRKIRVKSQSYLNQFRTDAYFNPSAETTDYGFSQLSNELTLFCNNSGNLQIGEVFDAYMLLFPNIVNNTTDNFIVSIDFSTDNGATIKTQETIIPKSAAAFLQQPFQSGFRYLFKLLISGNNIETFTHGGLTYEVNTETHKFRLIDAQNASGVVTLPQTVTAYPGCTLTSIDNSAFLYNSSITKINIPATVTDIGSNAFFSCYSLNEVNFQGTPQLTSIGDNAFSSCALTSITIPQSVTDIGSNAFFFCYSLNEVNFQGTPQLTSIGDNAFSGCALTSITIPQSVTNIGESAFAYCTSLSTVTLKSTGSLSLGKELFANTNLQTLKLYCPPPTLHPDGVFTNVSLSGQATTIQVLNTTTNINSYNNALSSKSNGWNHSTSSLASLTSGGSISVNSLSGDTGNITITANLTN